MTRPTLRGAALAAVASLAFTGSAFAAAFQNGSFETTDPETGGLAGWTVTQGDIDYLDEGFGPASDGTHFIDLNGGGPGTIAQTFDTVSGQSYAVTFDQNHNAGCGRNNSSLKVSAAAAFASFSHTGDLHSTPYDTHTLNFTATSSSTTLTFKSLSASCGGPILDNVRVSAIASGTSVTGSGTTNPKNGKPNQFTINAPAGGGGTVTYSGPSGSFNGAVQCVTVVGNAATIVAKQSDTLLTRTMVQDNGASGDRLVNTLIDLSKASAKTVQKYSQCINPDTAALSAANALAGDSIQIGSIATT